GEDPRPGDAVGHLPDRLPRLRDRRRRHRVDRLHRPCRAARAGRRLLGPAAAPGGRSTAGAAVLLGAAVVIVGYLNADRLAQARSFGAETVDVSKGDPRDQIEQILGANEVDCGVAAVGVAAPRDGRASSADETRL